MTNGSLILKIIIILNLRKLLKSITREGISLIMAVTHRVPISTAAKRKCVLLGMQKPRSSVGSKFDYKSDLHVCYIGVMRGTNDQSVFFNLSSELKKRDKMPDLPRILSLYCNKFNKTITQKHKMILYSILSYNT